MCGESILMERAAEVFAASRTQARHILSLILNMHLILRRIRGALGVAVTWTIAWVAVSGVAHAVTPTESGAFPTINSFLWNAMTWAISGTIGGLIFGMCLATDGRPQIRTLSVRRASLWGGASAIAFPLAFEIGGRLLMHQPFYWFHARMLAEYGLAGVLCGAGLVAIARRADRWEPELLDENDLTLALPAASFKVPVKQRATHSVT